MRPTPVRLRLLVPAVVLVGVACCSSGPSQATSGYRLDNDTWSTVVVHGCEPGCDGASVQPGHHLDFHEPLLRLRLTKAGGSVTCWVVMNGVLSATPPPPETLLVSGATPAAC
jgi:hypothetical protein